MTGQEIENVIEKLAEKLGVAVEKLQPIADQVIQQYVTRAYVWASFCGLMSVIFAIVVINAIFRCRRINREKMCDKYHRNWTDAEMLQTVLPMIVGLLAFLFFAFLTCDWLSCAIAPLPSILGL